MNPANYKEFTIRTSPFLPDLLSGILWELEIFGLTEEEDSLKIFAAEDSPVNKNAITDQIKKLTDQNLIEKYFVSEKIIPLKNWNEEWEKSREVIKVSERIIITPTFKNYSPSKDEIVLTIDPKMSFGTGEHQTTKLVLQLLEKFIRPGMKILDIGSGTGILSIASVKLGAVSAAAVDNDELCFDNCKENCELNGVSNQIKIICGEINQVDENDFDLVTANIQKNILIDIADNIKSKIKRNGIVILSGLLIEDEKEIVDCYSSSGFKKVDLEIMDEWIAIVLGL